MITKQEFMSGVPFVNTKEPNRIYQYADNIDGGSLIASFGNNRREVTRVDCINKDFTRTVDRHSIYFSLCIIKE